MCVKCHDGRTGNNWDSLLRRYGLRNVCDLPGGRHWVVECDRGDFYDVAMIATLPISKSFYDSWRCDCGAMTCGHVRAAAAIAQAEHFAEGADADYMFAADCVEDAVASSDALI